MRRGQLYADSSVYGFINATGDATAIRQWLRARSHRLYISEELNLGEALRNPDAAGRESRIRTMIEVSGQLTRPPMDLLIAQETYRAISKKRPGWVQRRPDEQFTRDFLDHRRQHVWSKLKQDPAYIPPDIAAANSHYHGLLGANRQVQKAQKQLLARGLAMVAGSDSPEFDAKLKAMDPIRQHWTVKMITDLQEDLTRPFMASADSDWLRPLLYLDRIFSPDNSEWARFWIDDADMDSMPLSRFYCRLVQLQPHVDADIGNTFDALHAVYLFAYPLVLTTDDHFGKIARLAQADYPTPGQVLTLDRRATSALAELQRVLSSVGIG